MLVYKRGSVVDFVMDDHVKILLGVVACNILITQVLRHVEIVVQLSTIDCGWKVRLGCLKMWEGAVASISLDAMSKITLGQGGGTKCAAVEKVDNVDNPEVVRKTIGSSVVRWIAEYGTLPMRGQ